MGDGVEVSAIAFQLKVDGSRICVGRRVVFLDEEHYSTMSLSPPRL